MLKLKGMNCRTMHNALNNNNGRLHNVTRIVPYHHQYTEVISRNSLYLHLSECILILQ